MYLTIQNTLFYVVGVTNATPYLSFSLRAWTYPPGFEHNPCSLGRTFSANFTCLLVLSALQISMSGNSHNLSVYLAVQFILIWGMLKN